MKQGVVYRLKCSNGSFYTWVTNNLEERLNLHKRGLASKYTAGHLPVTLVWNSDDMDIDDAILLEKQIKGWRREKKLALINHEYEKLPELARKYSLKKLDLSSWAGPARLLAGRRTNQENGK